MKRLKLLWLACGAVMMSVCSCSSSDEPDSVDGASVESRAQDRQQQLQAEYINNKGGLLLSAGSTEQSGVYDQDKLYWSMWNLFNEPVDADSGYIVGPPSIDMPLYAMQVRGCEPVVPFIGVAYDRVNYNRYAYPLVAEGGVVAFPVVKLPSGTLSLADYTLDGVYVKAEGKELCYISEFMMDESDVENEYIADIVDNAGEKQVEICANKTDKLRSFVLKFVNPSSEYVYENGENVIYITIDQEAVSPDR